MEEKYYKRQESYRFGSDYLWSLNHQNLEGLKESIQVEKSIVTASTLNRSHIFIPMVLDILTSKSGLLTSAVRRASASLDKNASSWVPYRLTESETWGGGLESAFKTNSPGYSDAIWRSTAQSFSNVQKNKTKQNLSFQQNEAPLESNKILDGQENHTTGPWENMNAFHASNSGVSKPWLMDQIQIQLPTCFCRGYRLT